MAPKRFIAWVSPRFLEDPAPVPGEAVYWDDADPLYPPDVVLAGERWVTRAPIDVERMIRPRKGRIVRPLEYPGDDLARFAWPAVIEEEVAKKRNKQR